MTEERRWFGKSKMEKLSFYKFGVGIELRMIDKCLDILQNHFEALLGIDVWVCGEFP